MGAFLSDGVDVDLWCVQLDAVTDLDRCRRLLSPDELAQESQFAFEKDRHRWVVTRAMSRTVLARYIDCDPASLEFVRNAYGKPSLAKPAGLPLSFNLSHAGELVACAVASGEEIGVDVEDTDRRLEYAALAKRFFAAAEASAIERAPPEKRRATFFRFWTLKEAYIKARGIGLSIPLDSFAFTVSNDRPPAISFTDDCRDEPDGWQFAQIRFQQRYQIALAIRLPHQDAPAIRLRQTASLESSGSDRMLPPSLCGEWNV